MKTLVQKLEEIKIAVDTMSWTANVNADGINGLIDEAIAELRISRPSWKQLPRLTEAMMRGACKAHYGSPYEKEIETMRTKTKFIDTSDVSDPSDMIDEAVAELREALFLSSPLHPEPKGVLITPHSARVYTGYDAGSMREYHETVHGLLVTVVG